MCFLCVRALGQESSLETALPAIRATGNTSAIIGALSGAAGQHMAAGRVEMAAQRVKESIALCIETNNANAMVAPLMIANQVLNKMGDDAAEKFFLEILAQESGNTAIEIQVLNALASALEQSGQRVRAVQVLHDHVARVSKISPNSPAETAALLSYGRICMRGGLYELGVPALKKSQTLAIKLGDAITEGLCDQAMADACMLTGDLDTAKQLLVKRFDAAKTSNNPLALSLAESALASGLVRLGDTKAASSFVDEAIGRTTSAAQRGPLESLKAVIAIQNDDIAAAVKWSSKSIDSKLAMIPAPYRDQLGGQTTSTDLMSLAHYQLLAGDNAAVQVTLGRLEQAYASTMASRQNAIALGQLTSADAIQTSLSFMIAAISNLRQQMLVSKNEMGAALIESELGRGRAQARAMRENFNQQLSNENSALTIDTVRQLAADRNVTFVEYSLVNSVDQFVRDSVPADNPHRAPRQLYIWVVPPSGQITFKAVPLKNGIAKLVDEFRSAILADGHHGGVDESDPTRTENPNADKPKSFTQSGRELYDLLIAPIESALPEDPDAEVVVIPQGPLYAIPFAALQSKSGKQFIDLHTLTTSGSIDLYRLSIACSKPLGKLDKNRVLIVGNPDMPSYLSRPDKPPTPLNPLPGSEAEAIAIGKMLGVEPLIGAAATETEVSKRMDNAQVIHLASHGLLESQDVFSDAYLSAIALAPSGDDNGFLTVREVMKKKLQADLVVLSACDSGRGEITGEGVIGLSRGYLTAGIPTAVVSLWPVSDRATAILMVNFYRALGEGKSKAAALRAATLANRERYEDPKLWAPFTMYGVGQ